MPFLNRVRLPVTTCRPQFPSERNVFSLADGSTRVQSIVIKKVVELETDYMPELIHQRLVIALSHDTVNIENEFYNTGVSIDAEYEIDWQRFMYYPVAKASSKLRVTPFEAINSNCQTCDDANQVELVDDTFPALVEEDATEVINVFANDEISCYPFTAEITWFNTDFVVNASIALDGEVTIIMKTPLAIENGVKLATYRVTCPNGGYDEADIYGDVDGTVVVCGQPYNLAGAPDDTSIGLSWAPPTPDPADGYEWELYDCTNPGTPVQTGTTLDTTLTITGMNPATCYNFYIRSVCGVGDVSAYVSMTWTTSAPAGADTCGLYELTWNDGSGDATHVNSCTVMYCGGVYYNFPLYNMVPRIICCQQHSPGNPVDIIGATSIIYQGLCP